MATIRIPNWKEFQHYKDRSPPWIKLHRKLLDNRAWHALSGDASKLLVECWLIASDSDDGSIDMATADLAWRLRRSGSSVAKSLQELANNDLIELCEQAASAALATCSPEERREEAEREVGASAPRAKRKHFIPEDWEPNDRHRQKAFAEGIDCDREAEKFRDHAAANNRKQVDWDAAFRLWLGNARPSKAEKKPVHKGGFRPYEDYTEDEWIAKVQAELI